MKKITILISAIFIIIYATPKGFSKYTYGAKNKEYIQFAKKGINLLKRKNYGEALRYLYYAAEYFPVKHGKITKGNIFYLIGYCNYKLEKYNEALKWYKLSLDFNPKSLSTYREIVRTLKAKNNEKLAKTWAYKIESYNPDGKKVLYHVAYIFQLAGDYKRAIGYYNHLLLNYKNDVYSLKQIANCYMELKEYKKSIDTLKRLLIRRPQSRSTIILLGIAYFKIGMYEKSKSIFNELINRNKRDYIAWYNLACVFAKSGKNQKAFDALEKSLKLGYGNFKQIRKDEDLKNIRNTKRFNELVDKYENKIKKRQKKPIIKKPFKK